MNLELHHSGVVLMQGVAVDPPEGLSSGDISTCLVVGNFICGVVLDLYVAMSDPLLTFLQTYSLDLTD